MHAAEDRGGYPAAGGGRGAGGAVVYASGYSEVGTEEGREADRRLRALCAELDMALMGPNCAGFMNYVDKVVRLCLHFGGTRSHRGRGHHFPERPTLSFPDGQPSMRFSYSISAGNCSVVSMEDYLQYLVDDEHTRVIGLVS